MKKKLIPFALLFTYLLPLVGCTGSKTCTITFDPNNGDPTFSITVNKGELLNEPESPEKTAYDFKAWRFNNIKWSFKYEKVQGDMTLVAYYSPIKYSVSYINNGGYISDKIAEYTIETKDSFANPIRPGYIFDGFVDQNGNKITAPKGNYGDKVLTPQWKLDTENFIEFGSTFDLAISDMALVNKLNEQASSSDFEGEMVYENETYLRFKIKNSTFVVADTYFQPGQYAYAKKVPITWLKIKELDNNKTLYFSTKILKVINTPSNYKSYSVHQARAYLNNDFISEFFTNEEASQLVEVSNTNNTKLVDSDLICETTQDKVFLLDSAEFDSILPRLKTFVLDTFSDGETRGLEYAPYTEYLSAEHSSYGMSGFHFYGTSVRNTSSKGCLYNYSMTRYSSTLGRYGASSSVYIRPCIVLEDK